MKIWLDEDEAWPVLGEVEETWGTEFEVPDELVTEWRELNARYWQVHEKLLRLTTRKHDR